MRNIIVRSIKSFEYTCKAANINTCTVDTITVKTPTNLKIQRDSLQSTCQRVTHSWQQ